MLEKSSINVAALIIIVIQLIFIVITITIMFLSDIHANLSAICNSSSLKYIAHSYMFLPTPFPPKIVSVNTHDKNETIC